MDSLIQIFDKMNSQTKNQMIMIIIGLLMPSLVYLTINFPTQIYNGDMLKVFVMSISINFATLFILWVFSMLTRFAGHKKLVKFIDSYKISLVNRIGSLHDRKTQLEIKLEHIDKSPDENESRLLEKELNEIDKDLDLICKIENKFVLYIENLLNPYKYLSEVSLVMIITIILISLNNVVFSIKIDFSTRGIFNNVYPYIFMYPFVMLYFNRFTRNPRFIALKKDLIDNNLLSNHKTEEQTYGEKIKSTIIQLINR